MYKEHKKRFLKLNQLIDREAYEFYKENRKKCAAGLNDFNLYKKAIGGIFSLIKTMIEESQGGLHIDGLGYFCMLEVAPKKRRNPKSLMQRFQKIRRFKLHFEPDFELKDWTISGTQTPKVRSKRDDYKVHFDLVKSVRLNKHEANRERNHRKAKGKLTDKTSIKRKIIQ